MKPVFSRTMVLLLLILLSFPLNTLASGNGNMDGGGSGMGQGTSSNYWTPGYDGVRITVVDASTGSAVSSPVDFSNKTSFQKTIIHFTKKSKLQYLSGASLEPGSGTYTYQIPATTMPYIMTSNSKPANMAATKRYFCSEYAAQMVADATGLSYDSLIEGKCKLVIEPVGYFTFNGSFYAMTATEAALYNQAFGGKLASKLPSTVHRNLPLALFLEHPDLGIPAWAGSSTSSVNDSQILSALGIGIVIYQSLPNVEIEAPDVIYRVNTDVITSITLTSGHEINPDQPANVTFHINGRSYTVNNIVIPAGGSQVVWAKWHTPDTPARLTITATVKRASTAKTSFLADIVDLNDNPPPDPLATDTNSHFGIPDIPSHTQKTSASWSVWYSYWKPDWEWCDNGDDDDDGYWVDRGWWEFDTNDYSASLSGSMTVSPDDVVPASSGDDMKSGYGIKETANTRLTVNAPTSHYAPAQTAVSYFPEFKYKDYWRLLTCSGGLNAAFQFQQNEYSTYNRRAHFTPLWYPDQARYTVYTHVMDVWTPSGMLSLNLNDSVQINGSLYDDWFSRRE